MFFLSEMPGTHFVFFFSVGVTGSIAAILIALNGFHGITKFAAFVLSTCVLTLLYLPVVLFFQPMIAFEIGWIGEC